MHRLLISAVGIGFLGFSCSGAVLPGSETKSLDELASGTVQFKSCAGAYESPAVEDKIDFDDVVAQGNRHGMIASLKGALTAVPHNVRQLFKAAGGRIYVTPYAATLCRGEAAADGSVSSCFKVGGQIGGRQDSVTIVMDANQAVLESRTVRAFGYLVSQYFGRLYKNGQGLQMKFGLNSSFKEAQDDVGKAFLSDLKIKPDPKRAIEMASRAYAEAFDSWYCHAFGLGNVNSRQVMKTQFPKTHAAFQRVEATVQKDIDDALARFLAPQVSAFGLQDVADAGSGGAGGAEFSAAGTTNVSETVSQPSGGQEPMLTGGTLGNVDNSTPVNTFSDPGPASGTFNPVGNTINGGNNGNTINAGNSGNGAINGNLDNGTVFTGGNAGNGNAGNGNAGSTGGDPNNTITITIDNPNISPDDITINNPTGATVDFVTGNGGNNGGNNGAINGDLSGGTIFPTTAGNGGVAGGNPSTDLGTINGGTVGGNTPTDLGTINGGTTVDTAGGATGGLDGLLGGGAGGTGTASDILTGGTQNPSGLTNTGFGDVSNTGFTSDQGFTGNQGGYVDQGSYNQGGYVDQGSYNQGGYVDQGSYSQGGYVDQGSYSQGGGGYVDQGGYSGGGYEQSVSQSAPASYGGDVGGGAVMAGPGC